MSIEQLEQYMKETEEMYSTVVYMIEELQKKKTELNDLKKDTTTKIIEAYKNQGKTQGEILDRLNKGD